MQNAQCSSEVAEMRLVDKFLVVFPCKYIDRPRHNTHVQNCAYLCMCMCVCVFRDNTLRYHVFIDLAI